MAYKLYPIAYTVDKDVFKNIDFYVLDFPKDWYDKAIIFYQIVKKREIVALPQKSLKEVIQAIYPDIININNRMGEEWLLSLNKISEENLVRTIRAWLDQHIEDRLEDNFKNDYYKFRQSINAKQLIWRKKEISLYSSQKYANNTANPEDGFFHVLPAYLCQKISSENIGFKLGPETFYFKSYLMEKPKELISWPPKRYQFGNKNWYYSIVLKLSVETIPFYSKPLILLKPSLRRWVSNELLSKKGKLFLPKGNSSVYILSKLDFVEHKSADFAKTMIGYNSNYKKIEWDQDLNSILNKLKINNYLPKSEKFIKDPTKYLLNGENNLALVYHNRWSNQHLIKSGVTLFDKKELSDQFLNYFPFIKQIKPKRVNKKMALNLSYKRTKRDNIDKINLRDNLYKILDSKILKFEIYYQDPKMKERLVREIKDILGLESYNDNYFTDSELDIIIETIKLNKIASKLDDDSKKSLQKRVQEIKNFLPNNNLPTAAVIELKKEWDKGDPKNALRKGFALKGRWTQFITPLEEKDEKNTGHRIRNSVWDLIRQIGFLADYPDFGGIKDLPNKFSVFGLWVIKKHQTKDTLPVVIYLNPDSLKIKVKSPITGNRWLTYGEFLLYISQFNRERTKFEKNEVNKFYKRIFMENIIDKNALVLASATNIRYFLPWFADKYLDKKYFWFSKRGPKYMLPGVRILRVREGEEIPDWYGIDPENVAKYTSGLFEASSGVFWSIAKKRSTEIKQNHSHSKVENLRKQYSASGILEIVPLLMGKNDNAKTWVSLVHKMKEMLSYYDESAKLPLPLHLAKKVEEYIV